MRKPHVALATVFLVCICSVAAAGPPFRTDDPDPVDYLHWEFYLASQQTFAGGQTDATLPHFEVNYGPIPDVQVHLVLPLGYVRAAGKTHYGYADTELGFIYRFVDETDGTPQIGTFPLFEIPTGNEKDGLGNGRTQVYLPLWLKKSWGRLTTFGGAGFWYNPGPDRKNWEYAGWEVQYDFSEAVTLGGELFHQTPDAPDSKASNGFTVGGFLNFDEQNHILFSVGRTFSGPGETSGYIAYQLTI